ncbi:MAG: hypothetical protein ABSD38_01380 [Syntrophorhabdales bacterium]|jgi:hypothetical protein
MADNDLMELLKQHRFTGDKYIFFLLAVAASGIGFSVEKTAGMKLAWSTGARRCRVTLGG